MPDYPVFDGHNDTLLRLVEAGRKGKQLDFLNGADELHIDLPRARRGGFAGGLFAMFTPNPARGLGALQGRPEMGAPIDRLCAWEYTIAMMDMGDSLVENSGGGVRRCTSAAEIRHAIDAEAMAMVYHIEGAEVIDPGLEALDELYSRGLRSIGIVWTRNNDFGHGVPFGFPGSPDSGPGLTDLGLELVRTCNRRRMMIDLSHLNEKGFWDVARVSEHPLVASHSNVHAFCATPRNLTEKQLDAIAETGGLVGLNFAVGFLREDGSHAGRDTPIETMLRHLDRLIEKLGEDGVGLGSDFDGCTLPDAIGDVSGLPALITAMDQANYGRELIGKITHRNWLGVLERTIG